MTPPGKNPTAFTLVETLVSMAIFLIIMAIVSGILVQFMSGSNRAASVMRSYDGVRMFGTQISTELGSAMVRNRPQRWLNLKVEDDDDATTIFFTAPDDSIRSVSRLNFISHYAYFWDKENLALHRAVYNTTTDPSFLEATATDADNKNRAANQQRLTAMTLAYRSGSAYGWTQSDEMKELMEQEPHQAILHHVFAFNVRCLRSANATAESTWNDPDELPLYVELELRVADRRMAGKFRDEFEETGELSEESLKKKKKLRRFVITVPMQGYGIESNPAYR